MAIISLINMKGGVGKTTLSTNICHCLSQRMKKKVLLIDIDPQFNSTQCLFSGDEYIEHIKSGRSTILDLYEEKRKIASTVSGELESLEKSPAAILPTQVMENFYILPGNLELYRIEMAAGSGRENKLKKYIHAINETFKFDYVIIDTPPTPSVWMTSALIASNYYLIPVKPDPISYTGVDLLKAIVDDKEDSFDLSIKCIGLIFTMVEREDSVIYKAALENIAKNKWHKYLYRNNIKKRAEIPKNQLNKKFILNGSDSELKSSLVGIVDELLERINNYEKKGTRKIK